MKKSKMFKIIAVLAVIVLAVAGGVLYYFFGYQTLDEGLDVFEIPDTYELELKDEFNNGYDESIWGSSGITVRRGGYWSQDQVSTKNGKLVIRTEYRDDVEEPAYYTGDLCTPKKRFLYGYYEIRCKVENTRGLWNAFWLMPDDIYNMEQKAQDGSEIDIFESALPYILQNAIYYDGYSGRKQMRTELKDMYDGYHTYGLDWKKDALRFYYDGKMIWELTDPDSIPAYPAYLNITTEINGSVVDGKPDTDKLTWIGCGNITDEDNDLPSDFLIDYIRIYDNGDLEITDK